MFISNYKVTNNTRTYICKKKMADFLIEEGFPLLSREGKKYIFARTERLDKVLNHLPLKLIFLKKVGVING